MSFNDMSLYNLFDLDGTFLYEVFLFAMQNTQYTIVNTISSKLYCLLLCNVYPQTRRSLVIQVLNYSYV